MTTSSNSRAEVLSGPVLVRILAHNVTQNLRTRTTPAVKLPTLSTLARDVVAQDRLIIVHDVRSKLNGR
jgi:hypothetical protein